MLIKNLQELEKFLKILPECKENEQYYIALFARKKYFPGGFLINDKSQLSRKTATKDRIIEKIKQMEVPYYFNGKLIPEEALALYITPNPRDLWRAGLQTLKEIAEKVKNGDRTYNPQALAMNCIQTSSSTKKFFDIDLDLLRIISGEELDEIKTNLNRFVGENNYTLIKTKGGFHILIHLQELSVINSKTWYKNINHSLPEVYTITMSGDALLPIPGCAQGGIYPYLI